MPTDLSGKRFGRLTVIKKVGRDKTYATFLCRCDCGNEKIVNSTNLSQGHVKSCGCLAKEVAIRKAIKMGKSNKTHGLSRTKFEKTYLGLRSRCENPKDIGYKNYGGRGIKCLWGSFDEFVADMYASYLKFSKLHPSDIQIDRIDNNGPYSKENCRWVTRKQNSRNRRTNIMITLDGETKCLEDWALEAGIHPHTLSRRLGRGMSLPDALKPRKKVSTTP